MQLQNTETTVGRPLGATDTAGAALFLNLGVSTLEKLRCRGGGPEYIKASDSANSRVSYAFADLVRWQEARKRRNTAGTSPLKGVRRNVADPLKGARDGQTF